MNRMQLRPCFGCDKLHLSEATSHEPVSGKRGQAWRHYGKFLQLLLSPCSCALQVAENIERREKNKNSLRDCVVRLPFNCMSVVKQFHRMPPSRVIRFWMTVSCIFSHRRVALLDFERFSAWMSSVCQAKSCPGNQASQCKSNVRQSN